MYWFSRYPGPPVNPPSGEVGPLYLCAADTADRIPIINNVTKPSRPLVAYGPLTEAQVSYLWGRGAGVSDDDWDNSCYLFHYGIKVAMNPMRY